MKHMSLLQENRLPEIKSSFGDDSGQRQNRQMLIALTLLLVALIVVLTKDREFWFPSAPVVQTESEPVEETPAQPKSQPQAATTSAATTATTTATTTAKPGLPASPKAKPHTVRPAAPAAKPAIAVAPVVTNRTVLPPLEVEVVAGDEHRAVQAGTNSVKVDMQPKAPVTTAKVPATSKGVTEAAGRVHLSPGAAEIVSRPVEPNYPLLAKQMKVQGAVVLQALIGRDGNIQDLNILSGPAILSTAAREAVKQWRFKPYLQSGQAVETEARITVNFTIWTQ
jgi:protein TonB